MQKKPGAVERFRMSTGLSLIVRMLDNIENGRGRLNLRAELQKISKSIQLDFEIMGSVTQILGLPCIFPVILTVLVLNDNPV